MPVRSAVERNFSLYFPVIRRESEIFCEFQSSAESRNIRESRNISRNVKYLAVTGEHLGKPEIFRENLKFSGDSKYIGEPAVSLRKSWNIFGILKLGDYDYRSDPGSWYFWILVRLAYFQVLRFPNDYQKLKENIYSLFFIPVDWLTPELPTWPIHAFC